MAKQEPITEKLRYDVSLYNSEFEARTVYKGATLKFIIESLNKLDGNIKTNGKLGNTVKGKSTNSKNVKPNPINYKIK